MAGREAYVPADHPNCKMFFPCDETSGQVLTDVANGAVIDYSNIDACYPDFDVVATYSKANAITLTTGTTADARNDYVRLKSGSFPVLDSSKVLLQMAVVDIHQLTYYKFLMGSGGSAVFKEPNTCTEVDGGSNFSFSGTTSAHGSINDGLGGSAGIGAWVTPMTTGVPYIMYIIWDGADTRTIQMRVLSLDGTEVWASLTTAEDGAPDLTGDIAFNPVTKTRGLHMYTWQTYEIDTVPADLDTGLLWIANQAVTHGVKSPYLPWSQ